MSDHIEEMMRMTREAAAEREEVVRKLVSRIGPEEHARAIGKSLAELRVRLQMWRAR